MKLIDFAQIEQINAILAQVPCSDSLLHFRIDVYSCKPLANDRKYRKTLDRMMEPENLSNNELPMIGAIPVSTGHTPTEFDACLAGSHEASLEPIGPLTDRSNRILYADLVATLSLSHPDYEFINVSPSSFTSLGPFSSVLDEFSRELENLCRWGSSEADPVSPERILAAIDEAMETDHCEVFSFFPPPGIASIDSGCRWTLHYILYNAALSRMAYISLKADETLDPVAEYVEREETLPCSFSEDDLLMSLN